MNCGQFARELDETESYDASAEMNKHMAECPACSLRYASLRNALIVYKTPLTLCAKDMGPRIAAMMPFMQKPRRVMALRNWLAAGLVLMVSMAFMPFLESFKMLNAVYGNGFIIPLGIVTGLAVSVYMIVFIATHVEDLSRRFRIRKHA